MGVDTTPLAVRNRLAARIAQAHARRAPLVMGILNVTPDSFSDGGRFDDPARALGHARRMAGEGCAILDIGGESTRPGAVPVAARQEMRRVLPTLGAIVADMDMPVSVDTTKADVARAALDAGAAMINDIWGLQGDPDMAPSVATSGACVVAMHNRREIAPDLDILDDLRRFFETSLTIAATHGIAADRIVLDPGIGFGKTQAQNLACIANLEALREFGRPVLLGVSRKSLIGHVLDRPVEARLPGTLAAALAGMAAGAAILRVHDVAAHVDVLRMVAAIGEARA